MNVAGLVLAGFDGTRADDVGPRALAALGVGGYVLFARNVESPEQVQTLLAGLSAHAPLLAVDQEGGRVARLRAPLTVWPPMARVGAAKDPELAREVGAALASEIGAVGFNITFAPVLDVRFEGTTIAIGDRSLGEDPTAVGELGAQLLAGIQAAGLVACAKHFPGHGHVEVDSHVALPVCPLAEDELRAVHLAPFRAAVAAGVDSVMTAHVVYPAVDPDQPATLSSVWIDGVLRKELGFAGVVFSDDLEMGAIVGEGGIGAAAVAAIRAGVDGLLVCRRLDRVEEVIASLRAEAEADAAFAARCEQSLGRLAALAARRPAAPRPLEGALGTPEHQSLADRLGKAAIGADPTLFA